MDKQEILYYLTNRRVERELFLKANKIRENYVGDTVHIRGVIHFSNYCISNDLYCGLRKDNYNIKRFRMKKDTIVRLAYKISQLGVKTIVLQSGEDPFYSCQMISHIITSIKKKCNVAITLSLGERNYDDFKAFKDAGADRYLMKHETMNKELYSRLRPGRKLKDRLEALFFLRKIGFQVGVGNIVGLPWQTLEDIAEDILFFQEFQPDMINIGPFIPHKDTPLGNYPAGDFNLLLRVFSLSRIVTLNSHIAAANTVATLRPIEGQLLCIKRAGANVLMPNCNPFLKSKRNKIEYEFQCAPKKRYVSLDEAKKIIKMAGRTISQDKGDSLKLGRINA